MGGHTHHRHNGAFANLCPDNCQPKPCSEDIYCGPNLAGSGINTGDSMVVALQKMDQVILNNFGPLPTTTTTTTLGTCVSYVYEITIYSCVDCSFISTGAIANSEPLVIGNYYPYNGNKIRVDTFDICSGGDPVAFIPGNSGTATCAELVCPTTTTTTTIGTTSTTTTTTTVAPACTRWIYNTVIRNCSDCSSFGVGNLLNSEPLTVGLWYTHNNQKIQITSLDFCDNGISTSSISDASAVVTCDSVICPTTTTTTTL